MSAFDAVLTIFGLVALAALCISAVAVVANDARRARNNRESSPYQMWLEQEFGYEPEETNPQEYR